jgi:hypothetical protein
MDGIKISNLKVSWPAIDHHSESDSQVEIVSETYFESADITKAFEASGIIEETTKFNNRYAKTEEAVSEEDNREEALIDFISDFEKDLKKKLEGELDKKFRASSKLNGYVGCDVTVNLNGDDSKNMHGSFEVRVSIDVEASEVNGILESVFESMR